MYVQNKFFQAQQNLGVNKNIWDVPSLNAPCLWAWTIHQCA